MLIKQLIVLRKVRTETLNFRTDLQDQVMCGWSATQYIIVLGAALVGNNFLQIPLKIIFHMKNKVTSHCLKFTNH